MATTTASKGNMSGIIALILIAVIAVGGYMYYKDQQARTTTINLPGDNDIEVTKPAE